MFYSGGDECITKEFQEKNEKILSQSRGHGYWLWKVHLIYETLTKKMNENDILVYVDSGCDINFKTGRKRFDEYGIFSILRILKFLYDS